VSQFIGVHDGHNASVALLRDGRLEFALQEERLTRVKNQGDAPAEAGQMAIRAAGRDAGSAPVGLNGHYMNYGQWRRETIQADYERPSRWKQRLKNTLVDRVYQEIKAADRVYQLEEAGFARQQMRPVEHHLAHASAAYYTSPFRGAKTLVLTCDGSGDRLSATVSIGHHASLQRIAEISEHDSIGRLYALVTRYLGMSPLEHEYKVMGLAPYASSRMFEEWFEFPRERPLTWRRRRGLPSMYAAYDLVRRALAGQRFDSIAAGAQSLLEHVLTTWARNAVRETGIPRIACAGGVFQNVKANLALLELPEVEEMYVFPSCGDESNSIGAACALAAQAGETIQPLGPLYFGDAITDHEALDALEPAAHAGRLRCSFTAPIEPVIAQALARGCIVARAAGKAEFGARALGNRSILAPASSLRAVRTLNESIKGRDFWMPFAPSVLAERASDYYDKPKTIDSPYMMFAFRSKPLRRAAFAATQHPHDFTTRPHEVWENHNPGYYRLLREYEARTGEGILLNTSFNLHGEPMVYRARDAVDVFLRSGLQHMALANWWVEKLPA
jgi:carbamoyltransferase